MPIRPAIHIPAHMAVIHALLFTSSRSRDKCPRDLRGPCGTRVKSHLSPLILDPNFRLTVNYESVGKQNGSRSPKSLASEIAESEYGIPDVTDPRCNRVQAATRAKSNHTHDLFNKLSFATCTALMTSLIRHARGLYMIFWARMMTSG